MKDGKEEPKDAPNDASHRPLRLERKRRAAAGMKASGSVDDENRLSLWREIEGIWRFGKSQPGGYVTAGMSLPGARRTL